MNVALAQIKGFLGNFRETRKQIIQLIKDADGKADFILFPEGGLFGYPPTDFIRNPDFLKKQNREIKKIQNQIPPGLNILLGGFFAEKQHLFNGVVLLRKGNPPLFFKKQFLSNTDVFRESRYFNQGSLKKNFFRWKGNRIQILICEDIFHNPQFPKSDILFCLNSSPYTEDKSLKRFHAVKQLTQKHKCPAVYVNRVGGQGSLIFDGGSFVLNSTGTLKTQCHFFEPDFQIVSLFSKNKKRAISPPPSLPKQREKALILGLQDFCKQTGFEKAHLGLSGGMDSAVVCYLAVQALGAKNVIGFFLPGPFTTNLSRELAEKIATTLNISLKEQNISPIYKMMLTTLFSKKSPENPVTKQNLQARIRALVLTAFGNETKSLLLGTGNKSELACGYSTLYGDLCGGLLPIGDLYKTEVYELARSINKTFPVFPKQLLLRAPSAELSSKQKDSDDLPPYKILDPILKKLLNKKSPHSAKEKEIFHKIFSNEFKRKQAPPLLKISETSFGEEWKFPIAHKFLTD
ncbi:MAG: NAD+ synthase [Bdellovibrionales bacterium]|nr:NAD+ synthase [Bdellovibrionales bacterium]